MRKRDKEDIERAGTTLDNDPDIGKVRMPPMESFTYHKPIMYPNIGLHILSVVLGTIGGLALIVGISSLGDPISGYAFAVSILFLCPVFYYFYYLLHSTRRIGDGRYPIFSNFFHHDKKGIFFTRHLDAGEKARFVPWDHIRKVTYSKSWKSICIVPEAAFEVTKKECRPYKVECVMIRIGQGPVGDLVLAIYDHGIPVMDMERTVYRSDILTFHSP